MTLAQRFGVKTFPFIIKDVLGNILYRENSNGDWSESTYDENGKQLTHRNSNNSTMNNQNKTVEFTMDGINIKFDISVSQMKNKNRVDSL